MLLNSKLALLALALLCTPAVQAETYKWDTVAVGGGGFVSGVIPAKTERGLFYARTDVGGAYRWDAQRERWIPLLDWLPEADMGYMGVESLAIDPKNAGNIYLMVGTSYFNGGKSAILRSRDYGRTFEATDITAQFKVHGNGMGRSNGERLQVDPGDSNVLYAGSRADGLFRSSDAGVSWNRMASLPVTATPNGNGISFVLPDPASVDGGAAQRLFVGVSRLDSAGPNLYFSYDGGASFEPVVGGPAGLMPHRAVLSPDGKLYITYANGAGPHPTELEPTNRGQVWEYDAVAGNWTDITPAGMPGPFSGISMDPADPRHLVLSTVNVWYPQGQGAWGDRIFTTRNAGRQWVDVVARGFALDPKGIDWIRNGAIHWTGDVQFDPFDTKAAWVISGNGVFRTANLDAPTTTWAFEVAGLEETVPFAVQRLPNGKLASVIGDFDGFLQDGPAQYGARFSPEMGTTTGLAASADGRVLARVGKELYYSSNGGTSWNKAPVTNGVRGQLTLAADGGVLLHSPEGGTVTYRSANYGASWSAVSGLELQNARPVADSVNPRKFYAYDTGNGQMLVSEDGGNSFAARGTLGRGGAKGIAVTPGIEGDIWACQSGGGLAHSTDSGASFAKIGSVAACSAVGIGKAAPGAGYPTLFIWGTVGATRGVLRSTDQGQTWVRVNDDAHQYGGIGNANFLAGDMTAFGTVYMSTVGRGIAYGSTAEEQGDVPVTPADPNGGQQQPNKCEYVVTASWQGGHIAEIRITNNRSSVINGWSVNWTYSDNSAVTSWWNAAVTGTSPAYAATANQSWNTDINPGSTVSFGMVVSGSTVPAVSGDVCK